MGLSDGHSEIKIQTSASHDKYEKLHCYLGSRVRYINLAEDGIPIICQDDAYICINKL